MEMHLVHFNTRYSNMSVAAMFPDGVMVLAVLFELTSFDNPNLVPILSRAQALVSASKWPIAFIWKIKLV